MKNTGKIIVLAFPDTFVKMSDELMCKILPLVGLGTRTHIKAGHAALVLIENETGVAQYFDFGRYITPPGKGRVRGALTDVELVVPVKAQIKNHQLINLNELLLWLEAHPEKTHGEGRLVASLCDTVDYDKALSYIMDLQGQGSIPYKAFGKVGSNCARFVTDAILASTNNNSIIKYLKRNKKFTPSTVGNVERSASQDGVYEVYNGCIKPYTSTALKENLTNFFDRKVPEVLDQDGISIEVPEGATFLDGTGSGAYFYLEVQGDKTKALVKRYTERGVQDFCGTAQLPEGFDATQPYKFVYDSNCLYCTIQQGEEIFRLELTGQTAASLMQKVRSA